jgi:hypothetical protein
MVATPCSVFLSWVDIIDGLFVEDNYDKVRSLYVLDGVWKCANWLCDVTPVLICCKFSLGTFLLAPMRMRRSHLNCSK